MSAQDELPTCECYAGPIARVHHERGPTGLCDTCVALRVLKITREEYTAMRAAVERCTMIEAALNKVTAERDEARDEAGTWRRYAHTEDRGYLREVGAAAEFPWERTTPTEGE